MAAATGVTSRRAGSLVGSALAVLASRSFAWGVIALGVAARVGQYLSGRSLWLDEAYLALNVLDRSFVGLTRPLDYAQGAPTGFLLLERVAVVALGSSELALRLVPLLAGVAALPLFLVVARRVLSPAAAGAALLLFAVLDGPIFYSAEVKQYSLDLCVTLGVAAVALLVLDTPDLDDAAVAWAAAVGVVAAWLSHAALLALFGVGVTLLAGAALGRDGRRLRRLGIVTGAWAASGIAVFLANVRRLANEGHPDYAYLSLPPRSAADASSLAHDLAGFLVEGGGLRLPTPIAALAAVLAVLGAVSIGRRRVQHLVLLVVPGVVVATASALERYPWGGRFTMFLLPVLVLLIVEGAWWLGRRGPGWAPVGAAGALMLVLLPSLAATSGHVLEPRTREEIEPAVLTLGRELQPGDALFVSGFAQYALRYYALERHVAGRRAPFPVVPATGPDRTIRLNALRSLPPRLVVGPRSRVLDPVPRGARVWVLLAHAPRTRARLAELDRHGRRLLIESHPGVVLALYDLSGPD